MTVGFYEPDGWGNWDETERLLDSQEAAGYADAIAGALHRAELPEEEAAASCTTMTGRMA